jgi:peptide/nickel transport system permease protein
MIRRLLHKPLFVVSAAWIALLALASILAPWLAPYGPAEQDITHPLEGPSAEHWLGTGTLGLDVLSRLLYGGRITLIGTVISITVYAAVGIPAGLWAGYRGGLFDRILLRTSDIFYAIPGAVLVLVVLAIRPGDETAAMITIGLLAAPSFARVVRSATLSVREQLFVRASQAAGLREPLIVLRHVLPAVRGTIIVHVALFATAAIGLETGLGFLGLGTTKVTWGSLVSEASTNLGNQPWLLVPSGLLIISFILALGLIGDAVRDASAEGYAVVGRPVRSRRRRESGAGTDTTSAGTDARPHGPAVGSAPGGVCAADDLLVTTEHPILAVRDLTVAFEISGAPTPVVSDVSFQIGAGQRVGLVGESGCGKSVTAMALLGLLKGTGRVTSGRMTFDGADYDLKDPGATTALRGSRIGVIGQDPVSGLDPCFTVGTQIAEVVRTHRRCSRPAAKQRMLELLQMVQMPDPAAIAGSYPHQLSGGMAQRVGIAAALAGEPDLLLADEPTTALDVTVQAEILDVLRDLGMAVVLVTHDWGVLVDLCERAVVMYAGQVVEDAPIEQIVRRPQHPYTAALLQSNPHFARRGEPLPAIGGQVLAPTDWPVGCRFAGRCGLAEDACTLAPIRLGERPSGDGGTRCLRAHEMDAMAASGVQKAGSAR